MEGAAFTNSVSMIFNKGYQEQQLRSLRKSLSSDQNNVLATILAERLKSSFGLRALPSLDDVLPFIHFDDAGQTHFTLIYASSLLSPFALICSHYFGRPLMNLQREVYHMLYSNTLNISDCDASEEESPSEPPVLAFANGVHRPSSCQQATGSSLVSSSALAEELSARREESRDDDDDSSDSLHSISARGLSPALTLTSVASANLPPPPSEELLQQTSAETAVPLKEGRAPPLATAGKTQSLAKRYQCDRCTKVPLLLLLPSTLPD